MPQLLLLGLLCFSGFALLLPVTPEWAVHGGADAFGAGLVTAVLMAATVLAQLLVRTCLRAAGWPRTLALGALLLGLPAPVQALSDSLWAVLATTAVRGLGFGILTVCGATAVATLAPVGRQGAAIGLYGLAIAAPQTVLTPAAPALATAVPLPAIIACGALPVLALPLTGAIGRAVGAATDAQTEEAASSAGAAPARTVLRRILLPLATLVLVTAAGGAVLTFTPQFDISAALAATALFVFTAFAAVARWGFGVLADRVPPRPLTCALLVTGIAGLVLVALAVGGTGPATAELLVGLTLLGAVYGGLQSITLVQTLDRAGAENRHMASVVWNIGYDGGTGLGSLLLGIAAQLATYAAGFGALAVVAGVLVVLVARSGDGRATGPAPATSSRRSRSRTP
jgi:MFS family permease